MIEVFNIRPVNKPGALQAFCSVKVDNGRVTYNSLRIMRDAENHLWVAMPSRAYKDREGKDKYEDYIQVHDKDLLATLTAAVQEAWTAHQQTAPERDGPGNGPAAPPAEPPPPPATEPRCRQEKEIRGLLKNKLLGKEDFHQVCRAVSFPRPEEATTEQWDRLLQACLAAIEGDERDPFAE